MHVPGLNSDIGHLQRCRYPFLLGTTSYIIPDNVVPNVRMLSPLVDDVELLLFESSGPYALPSVSAIQELIDIAAQESVGYTVHLPTDLKAGSESKNEQIRFCDAAAKAIERCSPLSPRAWVLHLEGVSSLQGESEVREWLQRCRKTIERLCEQTEYPSLIAIENLDYPWQWHEELAVSMGLSLCCDVGHLWLHCQDLWQDHISAMISRTKVIHLHGVHAGKDHLSLAATEQSRLGCLFELLTSRQFRGVVTLEVFNEQNFNESIVRLRKEWERLHS
jgi:sugar phosphate isomerase/epimerase